jgi:hypothetical protein
LNFDHVQRTWIVSVGFKTENPRFSTPSPPHLFTSSPLHLFTPDLSTS